MLGFERFEKFPGGPKLSFSHILQTLTDPLFRINARGNVEQALIGFSILHDGRRLPLHGKVHRPLALS